MNTLFIYLLLPFLWSCSEKNETQTLAADTMLNVSYGSDYEQKIDLYLPAGRNENSTKVLFLVHGGSWSGGSKDEFAGLIPQFRVNFPEYAIVNIGYRLATVDSSGYPKQITDIEKVIEHLESGDYGVSNQYAFLGTSAGAHLSMLYSYKYDTNHNIKAIVNIVGPTDFIDPSYVGNPLFEDGLFYLVGNVSYQENPELYADVSPITHVSAQSPPTIQFMGNQDPLIPTTQGPRLKAQLDEFNVENELHIYNAGHGNFSPTDSALINQLLVDFLNEHF